MKSTDRSRRRGLSVLLVPAAAVGLVACFDTSSLSDDTSGNGNTPGTDAATDTRDAGGGADSGDVVADAGEVPNGNAAIDVAGGQNFGCAVLASHAVWCWGANTYGQVGQPPSADLFPPTQVPGLTDAVAIRAGTSFVCVLKTDQTVACWGSNNEGQLGHDPATDAICAANLPCNAKPTPVAKAVYVTAISATAIDACTINTDGVVACWGDNALGQLGTLNGTSTYTPTAITQARAANGIVASGNAVSCFTVPSTGQVECLGSNYGTALGHPSGSSGDVDSGFGYDDNPNAEPVADQSGAIGGFSDLCYGALHGCGVVAGAVTCWGRYGGPNGIYVESEPTHEVTGTAGATRVACGAYHSCILQGTTGDVLCWGNNWGGAIGTGLQDGGSYGAVQSPAPVGIQAKVLRGGVGQTLAVDADGNVWQWGAGAAFADASIQPTPRKVEGLP